jgi:hypothetical protein
MSETYNGWSNYETWAVKLWLDNDGWQYERGMPKTAHELAAYLKEEAQEMAPDLGSSVYADLLGAAMDSVDWYEIAEAILLDQEPEEEDDEAEA